MLISELLKITKIPQALGVAFTGDSIVNCSNSQSPFIAFGGSLYYSADLTVERINILDCFELIRKNEVTPALAKCLDFTQWKQYQLYRFVALYFILAAAYGIKGQQYEVVADELIRYEKMLDAEIKKWLDFNAVKDMNDLKDIIRQDVFLRELSFIVSETKGTYKHLHTRDKRMQPLYFGNTKYSEATAKVKINVYEDKAILSYAGIDANAAEEVDFGMEEDIGLERKILRLLNKWSNWYMR